MMALNHKESGFTLIEMLVAMFIFSLISVGSMTALTGALQSKAQTEQRLSDMQEIEMSRTLIVQDMMNIILRENRDILGNPVESVLQGGENNLIRFTRRGRINPGGLEARSDLQRVEYLFQDQKLIRRTLAHENPTQSTKVRDRVLIDNLQNVRFEFITDTKFQPSSYVDVYRDDHSKLPKAVQVTLEFEDGRRLVELFELTS